LLKGTVNFDNVDIAIYSPFYRKLVS